MRGTFGSNLRFGAEPGTLQRLTILLRKEIDRTRNGTVILAARWLDFHLSTIITRITRCTGFRHPLSLFLYLSKALDDVARSAKLARHASVKFKYAKRKSNVASYRKIINQRYQELFLLGRMKRSQVFTRQSNLFDKWTNIYYSTSRVCRYCNYNNQCP